MAQDTFENLGLVFNEDKTSNDGGESKEQAT